MKHHTVAVLAIGLISALVLQTTPAHASGIELYLTPEKTTVKKGEFFTVQARINTNGATIDYLSTELDWPAKTLEFGGLSRQDSDFDGGCPDGLKLDFTSLYICREQKGGISGDKLIGTITYKALATATTIDIKFDAENTQIIRIGEAKPLLFTSKITSVIFAPPADAAGSDIPGSNFKENGQLPSSQTVDTGVSARPLSTRASEPVKNDTPQKTAPGVTAAQATKPKDGNTTVWVVTTLLLAAAGATFYRARHSKHAKN